MDKGILMSGTKSALGIDSLNSSTTLFVNIDSDLDALSSEITLSEFINILESPAFGIHMPCRESEFRGIICR